MLDAEAALNAASPTGTDNDVHISEVMQNNPEVSGKDITSVSSPEDYKEIPAASLKDSNIKTEVENNFQLMPIILVNDKPPEELDQSWANIVETVTNSEKFKAFHTRRKFKRKFCRSRRHAVFKRSYSIG